MKPVSPERMEKILFAVLGIVTVVLLTLSAAAHNIVYQSRPNGTYTVIRDMTCERKGDVAAPIGVVKEFRFILDDIKHADTLAFYISHHAIEIYLADECVYMLMASDDVIRTAGEVWVMLPLYEEDTGKEIRIVLSPLYHNYQDKVPEFLLGSELAIYQSVFYQSLPELMMSLCVVLAGLFLLGLAVYHSGKHQPIPQLYTIGSLAVSAGVWRFTYGKFAYLLWREHTVFLYTLSIVALMVVALTMLKTAQQPSQPRSAALIRLGARLYGAVDLAQLLLQLAGILDLRQMLLVTHGMIVGSAVVLGMSSILAWRESSPQRGRFLRCNDSWMLGIGAVMDLLLYYFADTSVGMLFTLSAILCFSLLKGIRIYTEQKHTLAEMETQLTLSRTSTLMSQIRSHFVFNILNAISGMCKYDPEKADDTIVRFARYLRNNIDMMENDQNIPFSLDLRRLEDYVILEQVRFGDKIEFYTDIEVDDFMIPPLILQPVVENAIKHGLSRKSSNGTIILRTRDRGDRIVVTVEDDGVGFDTRELEKETSVGIKNIRFRLYHLVHGTLEIASEVGKGTTVTITLPKEETSVCTSFM